MIECLMSWYGITDLRASLGFEQSTGPVLGALLDGDYTDVVILGFTNASSKKTDSKTELLEFQKGLAELENPNFDAEKQFVSEYANTEVANGNFIKWLGDQLKEAGKVTKVHFFPIKLKHLNDTQGIYEVATMSLNSITKLGDRIQISLYLSPGTPVMAFVWAFASLRFPHMNIRLIASSQIGSPPEKIELPHEWLEWHGRHILTPNSDSEHFDVIFHLFGEQRVPNLQGVLQFSCKKHVFVYSSQFSPEVMKKFIENAEYGELLVDPYDPESVQSSILDEMSELPQDMRVGFNLTGGTKLMFAGAYAACRRINATPFYLNGQASEVIFLNDFKRIELKKINSVEKFIMLNVDDVIVSDSNYWKEAKNNPTILPKLLMENKSDINNLYRKKILNRNNPKQFVEKEGEICIECTENKIGKITVNNQTFEFNNWKYFVKYLTGQWFEEYIYTELRPLVESNLILDMRIELKVSAEIYTEGSKTSDFQEFDVIFTDGVRLFIIECKSGIVTSQHCSKLEVITRNYGGIESKGILVSCFDGINKGVRMKFEKSKNVELIGGGNFMERIKEIILSTQN